MKKLILFVFLLTAQLLYAQFPCNPTSVKSDFDNYMASHFPEIEVEKPKVNPTANDCVFEVWFLIRDLQDPNKKQLVIILFEYYSKGYGKVSHVKGSLSGTMISTL